MKPTRLIQDAIRRVQDAAPGEGLGEDLRRNLGEVVSAALSRLDLVTREEFDLHLELLAEAQARIQALEERIEAIEEGKPPPARTTAP